MSRFCCLRRPGCCQFNCSVRCPPPPIRLGTPSTSSVSRAEPQIERRGPRGSPIQVSSRASSRWLRWAVLRPRGLSVPVVVIADYDDELHGLGALADGAACGEVVKYLSDLGHRSFLHLAGKQDFASARNRRQTFVQSIDRLGLRGMVIDCDWSGQSGYEAVTSLPSDTDVTAVVAANDAMAMGAVRASLSRDGEFRRTSACSAGTMRNSPDSAPHRCPLSPSTANARGERPCPG